MSTELDTVDEKQLPAVTAGDIAVRMVETIERAARDPEVDVGKMERLWGMQKDLMAEQAKREYMQAFAALQLELPEIEETKPIPDAHGKTKFMYTPYRDIMKVLRPLLRKHGFATSRSQTATDKSVTEHLTVMHRGGHSTEHTFTVRQGSGPPKSGAEQASGSAGSFAARYALRDAFDLIFVGGERAEDVRQLGSEVGFEKGAELFDRVEALGRDHHKVLGYAGVQTTAFQNISADDYAKIHEGRVADVEQVLSKLERQS